MADGSDFIEKLISDRRSGQAARKLARATAWREVGSNGRLLWGKCRSRGTRLFFTVVETTRPFYYCNCSSRKRPCSHVLALYFLYADGNEVIRPESDVPDWVVDLRPRMRHHESEPEPIRDVDAEARREARLAKRAKRIEGMRAGLLELEDWMADVLRQGLAKLTDAPADLWEDRAARLVDAKLGSLARRVRGMARIVGQDNWYEELLDAFGQLYLLVKAYEQLEDLPASLQYELYAQGGLAMRRDEVLEERPVPGTWVLVGQISGAEDDLRFRRAWFYEPQHKRFGLVLDFVWGDRPFERDWTTGRAYSGNAHFYPAALPQRMLFDKPEAQPLPDLAWPVLDDWRELYRFMAHQLSENPWLVRLPVVLRGVPHRLGDRWVLVDGQAAWIPFHSPAEAEWSLLALSGGHPITLFGEWDGRRLEVLSVPGSDRVLQL